MKILKFILFNISFIIISCSNNNPELIVQNPNNQVSQQRHENLKINIFKALPKEMDGYGCYLFNSEEDMKKSKYLCVGVFEIFTYIFVNEKLSQLKLSGVNYQFRHVKRHENKVADKVVNQILDKSSRVQI